MELWDLYNVRREPLGRTHRRGTPMRRGEYHLVVFVWVFNGRGKLLLTKRSPEKMAYPDLWENTGGSVLAGESSLHAIRRELFEETGIRASEDEFHYIDSAKGRTWFSDTYYIIKDVPLCALRLQPGETCDARWVDRRELERMIEDKLLARPDVQRLRQRDALLTQFLGGRPEK